MNVSILRADLPLPDLLDSQRRLRLLPAEAYDAIDPAALRLWCHLHARYHLPTVETIAWLHDQIDGRDCIEIGSGCGDLAYHLGVPATDSRLQEQPNIQALYAAMGQPTIAYPPWVEKLDALAAIAKYQPQVVVASWLTQWANPIAPQPPGGGSPYGVRGDLLLDTGVTFLFLGNRSIHGRDRILSRTHREFALPFLRSRSAFRDQEVAYLWQGRH